MIPDLRVRHRLLLMPLLATAALFVVFVVAESSGSENQRLLRSLSARLTPALQSSESLEDTLGLIQRKLQNAVAEEDESVIHETQELRDEFLFLITELRQLGVSDTRDLGVLEDQFLRYYDLAAATTRRLIYAGRTDADLVLALETMTRSYSRLNATLEVRTQEARQAVSSAFAATVRNDTRARIINGIVIFASAILLCIVSFYLARSLTKPLSELVNVLRLSEQDSSVRATVAGGSEVSSLASAFNDMMDKIGKGRSEIEAHSWMMTGLSKLGVALGSPSDLRALGDAIVASLAEHTGALVGVIYLATEGGNLKLVGEYGCAGGNAPDIEFQPGEGLLGQAMKNRRAMLVSPVPAEYLRISSGLGTAPPKSLLIAPIARGGVVEGVVELGSYDEFSDQQVEFVDLSGERIVVALDSLRFKLGLQTALHRTRQQAQELEESQQQLAEANHMLEERTTRLETSNEDLEAFAYVASHDLQEPLRKIEVYAQRFEKKCSDGFDPSGQEYLKRMRSACQRMRTLINDLLGFSRVTTRAEPFRRTELETVIQQVIGDLEVPIQQAGAQVVCGQMPAIHGDPVQLGQLFQNLISNALKFRREGLKPSIRISSSLLDGEAFGESTSPSGSRSQITVEDNGIGIEEKHFERIFEVFQRLHGRSEYEGTGIGLALCRKIVDRHGGEISVDSTPGQGTKFSIILPATEVNEGENHESAA